MGGRLANIFPKFRQKLPSHFEAPIIWEDFKEMKMGTTQEKRCGHVCNSGYFECFPRHLKCEQKMAEPMPKCIRH
jgi:hypothetical protein